MQQYMPPQPILTTNDKGEKVLQNADGSKVNVITQADGSMVVQQNGKTVPID
jgi:hypothetical protein